jgi:hypothetical protein
MDKAQRIDYIDSYEPGMTGQGRLLRSQKSGKYGYTESVAILSQGVAILFVKRNLITTIRVVVALTLHRSNAPAAIVPQRRNDQKRPDPHGGNCSLPQPFGRGPQPCCYTPTVEIKGMTPTVEI